MSKKYKVLLQGIFKNKETFRVQMVRLGVAPEIIDKMVEKPPVILKGDLTMEAARRYADAVQEAGGSVAIQEDGRFQESRHINHSVSVASLEDFTMCPECGFKQQKGEVCVKCGFRLKKY
ncbi:MAG: hypothetical protein GY864_15105 [Desulfobacterales bacterium]|nr:hypothetical protein [Desulfobacterales bacterium]